MDPFRAVQEEVSHRMADILAKPPKNEQQRQRKLSELNELNVDLQEYFESTAAFVAALGA